MPRHNDFTLKIVGQDLADRFLQCGFSPVQSMVPTARVDYYHAGPLGGAGPIFRMLEDRAINYYESALVNTDMYKLAGVAPNNGNHAACLGLLEGLINTFKKAGLNPNRIGMTMLCCVYATATEGVGTANMQAFMWYARLCNAAAAEDVETVINLIVKRAPIDEIERAISDGTTLTLLSALYENG